MPDEFEQDKIESDYKNGGRMLDPIFRDYNLPLQYNAELKGCTRPQESSVSQENSELIKSSSSSKWYLNRYKRV